MNARNHSSDSAVSPVVGVMLMLVVTIVIAALVSAFAGGLGETQDATPMITFKADLSVADGLTLTCLGATPGKNLDFDVVVGDGSYYKVSSGNTQTFSAGNSITVMTKNLQSGFTDAFGKFDGYEGTGMYISDRYIGKTYTIQLISDEAGVIGKAYATLKA